MAMLQVKRQFILLDKSKNCASVFLLYPPTLSS